MLNVLLVSPAGVRGGVGTVIHTLASGLHRRGAAVTVLSLSDGALVTDLRRAGLECELRPVRSKFALPSLTRAAGPVLSRRFDVVHTHGPRAMFALNPAARLARVPAIVTTVHGVASVFVRELGAWRYQVHHTLERAIARGCTDGLVVWADSMIDDVERRGFRRRMVHHIDNPVDTVRFAPLDAAGIAAARRRVGLAPAERAIGIVGRLVPLKGQHVLLDAFARASAWTAATDVRLVIAGDGPSRADLETRAAAHGITSRVTFLGDVSDPEIVMNACDIAVYPSTHGIIGLTALEAMACGAALIASDLPGTTEFVTHGHTALLVPPADVDALARALVTLLERPAMIDTLRRAGREMVVRRFNPDRFIDRHLDLYARLAHPRR